MGQLGLSSIISFIVGVYCFLRSHWIGPNGELRFMTPVYRVWRFVLSLSEGIP